MAINLEDMKNIKEEIFAEADIRYVHIDDCTDKQAAVSKKFANDDKRIELIDKDISLFKKLIWALVTATITQCVISFFELIKG